MDRKRISLKQKFFLLFLGISFSLLIIELGLRLTGWLLLFRDNLRNKSQLSSTLDKNTIKILCLGPCYTVGVGVLPEDSYPWQLEQILQEHYPGKSFLVINRGVRGKNLSFFVNNLGYLIRKFKPQIIILNINSRITLYDENLPMVIDDSLSSFDKIRIRMGMTLRKLKIYQMLVLIASPSSFEKDILLRQLSEERLLKYSSGIDEENAYALEIKTLQEKVSKYPNDASSWRTLAQSYAKLGLYDLAVENIKKAIALNPKKGGYYLDLSQHYSLLGEYALAVKMQKKAFAVEPSILAEILQEINDIEKELILNPEYYRTYHRLAKKYALIMNYEKAIELTKKAISMVPSASNYDRLNFYAAALQLIKNKTPNKKSVAQSLDFNQNYTGEFMDGLKSPLNGPEAFRRLLRYDLINVIKITRKYKILFLLENMGSSLVQQEIIKNICSELNVPLADLYTAFQNRERPELLFHPYLSYRLNKEGNKFIAQEIYQALMSKGLLAELFDQ